MMDDQKLNELIDAWIAYYDAPKSREREKFEWAAQAVLAWSGRSSGDSEMLWQFIMAAYKRDLSDLVLANLAAGPVEDLIANFGAKYIDRIEELARQDPRFNQLLGGVWKRGGPGDIWDRVIRARNTEW
jgi:hypothetical protein